jgi:hypothetical protein
MEVNILEIEQSAKFNIDRKRSPYIEDYFEKSHKYCSRNEYSSSRLFPQKLT